MLKKLGSWIGTTKQYIRSIQNEVADFDIDTNETEETTKKKDNDKV
jgi:sec-independent protein translocase protein TatB